MHNEICRIRDQYLNTNFTYVSNIPSMHSPKVTLHHMFSLKFSQYGIFHLGHHVNAEKKCLHVGTFQSSDFQIKDA